MQIKTYWRLLALVVLVAMALGACQPQPAAAPTQEQPAAEAAPTEAPQEPAPAVEEVGGFQIPAIEEGKFNVAMVLIGPHDDGGWSQAHYEGLVYVQENVPDVHIAYVENVPEGAELLSKFSAASPAKALT